MGWTMMQMPEVIFAMAIATATFPTLSQQVAEADRSGLQRTVSSALRAIVVLTLPSAVILFLLGRAFISVLFRSAVFGDRAADMVYWSTAAFTVGLMGHSVLEVAARVFYAHKNTITPFWLALGATLCNIALCLALAPLLGQAGLALANSIAVTLQSGTLLWLGWRSRVHFDWTPVWRLTWRASVASAAMAGSIVLLLRRGGAWGPLWIAFLGTALGGTVYLAVMGALNQREARSLLQTIRGLSTPEYAQE
jgi:putative peptidoglycan lipid II flippase